MPLAYLLLLTLAEALTVYASPAWGLGLHAALLPALLLHAALGRDAPLRALALALCSVPIIRILPVSLPPVRSALLWVPSLALVLLACAGLRLQRDRWRAAAGAVERRRWTDELSALLKTPAPDTASLERLACLLHERIGPAYVLIAGYGGARNQALVELAVGASGRRLRGVEGLDAPWSAFVDLLAQGKDHGAVIEAAAHPFSRRRGDYLLLPLTVGRRWAIVSLRPDQGEHARVLLAPLAPTLARRALGEPRTA
jgi:hypothetical protein